MSIGSSPATGQATSGCLARCLPTSQHHLQDTLQAHWRCNSVRCGIHLNKRVTQTGVMHTLLPHPQQPLSPRPMARRLAATRPAGVSQRSSTSPGMPPAVKNTTGMYSMTPTAPPGGGPTSLGTVRRRTTRAGHQSCPSTLAHTTAPGRSWLWREGTATPRGSASICVCRGVDSKRVRT